MPQQHSPPASSAEPIALRCPRCLAEQKKGLLGYVRKYDMNIKVQNALKPEEPLMLADIFLHCDKHNLDVVYMIVAVS